MSRNEKTIEQRIRNVIGQLEGVSAMLAQKGSCFDALVQLKAAKSGVSAIMDKYLNEEVDKCLGSSSRKKEETLKRLLAEVCKK